MASSVRAVGVAFSWLTVLPIPHSWVDAAGPVDRRLGGAVMSAVPVVGAVLGGVGATLTWGLSYTDLPSAMIGFLLVAALGLATRGMHLDGLADTADGLGCYGTPERVAEVMRSGTVGPFGVATVVGVIVIQGLGFAALGDDGRWYAIALAIATGRVAAVIGTRQGLGSAHPNGFGALVAGTQHVSAVVWPAIGIVAAAVSGLWLAGTTVGTSAVATAVQAVVAAGVVWLFTWAFTRHCARRMGGISGDVLGAVIELGTTLMVIGLLV
ncbi:adenosylcobinamide-GDP ribazoletransferase [Gordonia sp. DT218]|uniref:adenosylcobinamide-GDP ribazoletransferase n=1 Tax=Gordonia sp. DT218 TaxID=3416659 RepID=UPI003CEC085E